MENRLCGAARLEGREEAIGEVQAKLDDGLVSNVGGGGGIKWLDNVCI